MAKFIRTPETIAQDQRAAEMRSRSMTYQQIGDALGISRQAAHQAVQRAIKEIPTDGADEVRRLELEKLDYLERRLFAIMQKDHLRVSASGKVVNHLGEPVTDDSPVMQAITGLLKVAERRSKLLGLDSPTKMQVEQTNYEPGSIDAEVAQLRAILSAGGQPNVLGSAEGTTGTTP